MCVCASVETRGHPYLLCHSPIPLRQGLSLHLEFGWKPGSPSSLLVSAFHSTEVSRVYSFDVGEFHLNSVYESSILTY